MASFTVLQTRLGPPLYLGEEDGIPKWKTTSALELNPSSPHKAYYRTLHITPLILLKLPVNKLSNTMTSWPSPTSRSTRLLPIKPQPPVTITLQEFTSKGYRDAWNGLKGWCTFKKSKWASGRLGLNTYWDWGKLFICVGDSICIQQSCLIPLPDGVKEIVLNYVKLILRS